jgi:AraC-like DNA-binding protein
MHLARFDEPGTLGALGYLFMSAASLLDAFEGFCGHLDALQEDTTNRLLIGGDAVTVQYRINDGRIRHRRHDAEYSISAMYNLVRLYAGVPVRPRAVHFEHRRAGKYATYRDHFQCEVLFEQPCNELVYRREGFNLRSRHRSHLLNPIIASHLSTLSARHGSERNWQARVAEMIEARISDRHCTLARVARALGVSASTLIRRLREEHTSFAAILRERRLQHAERLLLLGNTPVAAIALAVGYAENASFTRAFRRQHAKSPEQYRRAHRDLSA